jgi:hypothetical protein
MGSSLVTLVANGFIEQKRPSQKIVKVHMCPLFAINSSLSPITGHNHSPSELRSQFHNCSLCG